MLPSSTLLAAWCTAQSPTARAKQPVQAAGQQLLLLLLQQRTWWLTTPMRSSICRSSAFKLAMAAFSRTSGDVSLRLLPLLSSCCFASCSADASRCSSLLRSLMSSVHLVAFTGARYVTSLLCRHTPATSSTSAQTQSLQLHLTQRVQVVSMCDAA